MLVAPGLEPLVKIYADRLKTSAEAGRACVGIPWVGSPPPPSVRVPNILEQMGTDPVSKQAEAIKDLAAAIRELADVIYQVGTED